MCWRRTLRSKRQRKAVKRANFERQVKIMAEETKNVTENQQTDGKQTEVNRTNTQQEDAPTVEQLMEQLAEAKAESQKYQNKYNQASSEAAASKKALRARQTAEEREAEEKAEAQRLADEERENLKKELNHIKAVAAYKAISEDKTVEMLIEAVSEADHSAIATIIENEKQKAVKEAKVEWMKSRPPVNAGQYSSMTKEQIMAIPDRDERRKAMAQNMDLFK
jgi:hypothetical protein